MYFKLLEKMKLFDFLEKRKNFILVHGFPFHNHGPAKITFKYEAQISHLKLLFMIPFYFVEHVI